MNSSSLVLFRLFYRLYNLFSTAWWLNIYDFLFIFLWFSYRLITYFSCTWLAYTNNFFLVLLRFTDIFTFGCCAGWMFNLFNDLLLLVWMNDFSDFSGCTCWNLFHNPFNFPSPRKNIFTNFSWSRLRYMFYNLLSLYSFRFKFLF